MPWRSMAPARSRYPSRICLIVLSVLCVVLSGVHAQQGQFTPIDILGQRGCDVGTALEPNMQDCAIDQGMGSNGTVTLTFKVGPKPKYSILLTLRSVGGVAQMQLYNSGEPFYRGTIVYFNDAITESFIRVPAEQVTAGQYTLVIQGVGGATPKLLLYLRVQTPAAGLKLAASDKAALQSVLDECCPDSGPDNTSGPPFCTQFLPTALAPKTIDDDLCNIGDFVCDNDGHLQKVDFSNADLDCKKGFPAAFGKLPSLETLTLRFNNFNGDTLDNVAAVLADSRHLRRLMIGAANLTGTVPCALVEEHAMMTLMFSNNTLEGTLPACFLESPTLQELYMSLTTLSGPLPDSFTTKTALKVWYAINADPSTGELAGPGFTGELPSSMSSAGGLQYVQLSNHQLTGGVPALPPNIIMYEVQGNQLDGSIASPLPASLVYIDCSSNSLTGPVPDFSQANALTYMDLDSNQLTGSIPADFGAAGQSLMYLDLSNNTLEGNINEGNQWEKLPLMQYLLLADNNLEGFVPASLGANTQIVLLHLGGNMLTGNLTAFANALQPAHARSPQQAGGRKLRSVDVRSGSSRLVARKLFGGYEDQPTPEPIGWQYDIDNIRALATHDVYSARRRLQQAAAGSPAPAATPADTPTGAPADTPASTPADSPASTPAAPAPAPEPEVVASAPAPGGATTTTMAPEPAAAATPAQPQEPSPTTEAPQLPEDQPTASSAGDNTPNGNPQLSPAAAAQAAQAQQTQAQQTQAQQGSSQQNDIALMPVPTSSALQGNSFLYLNVSNNDITGSVPTTLSDLEMFRNPANSTDPYDMYSKYQGGQDRALDLTNNRLYGEFPMFIIQAGNLQDGCSCITTFNVTDGNFLYCPTKDALAGVKLTGDVLRGAKANNYTCLVPKQQTVPLADYLSKPTNWLTSIPAAADVVTEKTMVPREATRSNAAPANEAQAASSGGGSGGLSPGAIAGIVIGVVGGLAVISSLAYFVGYKRFYKMHKATSFRKGEIPDGPVAGAGGPYPAAAYGAQPPANGALPVSNGAAHAPGFDIETPGLPPRV